MLEVTFHHEYDYKIILGITHIFGGDVRNANMILFDKLVRVHHVR